MEKETLTKLITEMRLDFQLPPYMPEETIERAIRERFARLVRLKIFDPDTDAEGRNLLKNAAYYELYHRYEEFEKAYQHDILSWQLGEVIG